MGTDHRPVGLVREDLEQHRVRHPAIDDVYGVDTGLGRVNLSGAGTKILKFDNQTVAGLPALDRGDYTGWPADLRARLDASLTHGPFRGAVGVQYTG